MLFTVLILFFSIGCVVFLAPIVVDDWFIVRLWGVENGGDGEEPTVQLGELNCWFGRWEALGGGEALGCAGEAPERRCGESRWWSIMGTVSIRKSPCGALRGGS